MRRTKFISIGYDPKFSTGKKGKNPPVCVVCNIIEAYLFMIIDTNFDFRVRVKLSAISAGD